MTIATQQSLQIFIGNGVTNSFDFSFVSGGVPANIIVSYSDANGLVILPPSLYTLFLNPPATGAIWGIGGTVTYPLAGVIADGTILTVSRVLPLTQTTSIANQGPFAPKVTESALDTLEMQLQQLNQRTGIFRGIWITNVNYEFGDYVIDGVHGNNTGNYYVCIVSNLSGTWSTDLAAGDWNLVIDIQQIKAYVAAAAASAAAASASATAAATSATSASNSAAAAAIDADDADIARIAAEAAEAAAAISAAQAANYAASYSGTSTTSLAITTGAKVFTTQANKLWVNGQFLQIASNASALNYMHGTVTSYSGTTLTMNITDIGGTGTHTDWNISISGTQGAIGPAGPGGDVFSNTSTSVVDEIALFADTTGKLIKRATTTGILKGTSGVVSAATSGTDYSVGTSGLATGIVKSTTGTGALSIAVPGTDYLIPGGVGTIKAWVNYYPSVSSIRNSFNVSSVTNSGGGKYIVNFITPFSSDTYATIGFASFLTGIPGAVVCSRDASQADQTISSSPLATWYSVTSVFQSVDYVTAIFVQ